MDPGDCVKISAVIYTHLMNFESELYSTSDNGILIAFITIVHHNIIIHSTTAKVLPLYI